MSPRALDLAGIAADADTMTETEVYTGTPEWHALLEWLEFHGIDPKRIPAVIASILFLLAWLDDLR